MPPNAFRPLFAGLTLVAFAVASSPFHPHSRPQTSGYRGPNPPTAQFPAHPSLAASNAPSLLEQPAGNPFRSVYEWRTIDFAYASPADRQTALATGAFVPANNLPLGIDRWRDRLFVTLPRWKNGVPATLAWLPYDETTERQPTVDPPMRPYPGWSAHADDPLRPDCSRLMSVYRTFVDRCDRLWAIDAGVVNATVGIRQVCPPKIVAFDLHTDAQLFAYELPADQVRQDSLHSNIVVDVRPDRCTDAHAYVTDVWRYGLTVFSLRAFRSWRTTSHRYLPEPALCDYRLHGLRFQWTDGVFGVSLGAPQATGDRDVFYHPMSSYAEFAVRASVLQNESLWLAGGDGTADAFRWLGERGRNGQSSTAGLDATGVQFFTLVQADGVACWDTTRPYDWRAVGMVARDNRTLVFPNDLSVDGGNADGRQSVWVLSNRLPVYLYARLDERDVNFRVQRVAVEDAVRGTVCDRRRRAETVAGPYAGDYFGF